jgi:type II secretory pathway predicted ATPase ExeA
MYRKHFGLSRHAFSKEIETDDLYASNALKELETRLNHLIELRGIGLITGESGSGKTTVCRKVLSGLHAGLYRVVYVQHSTGNVMDTYKTIAWELGLSVERSRAALFRQIRTEVTRLASETRCRPLLMVDEAHHLRADVLEDLRLLTNYAMDSENRLTLVFVGHPELRRRLGLAAHEALSQRIVVRANVTGLRRDELDHYVAHLLRRAGTELPLFEPAALEAIFQATNGLPRRINQLCHFALLAAAMEKAKVATADHVGTALPEIG